MSIIKINHYSKCISKYKTLTIIGDFDNKITRDLKVIYFLHGLGNDAQTILNNSDILKYTEKKNIILIFPDVSRSFYTNTVSGARYFDYVNDEIPQFLQNTFNFNLNKENVYIAGISMGGYGAIKFALSNPSKFSKVFSLSGSLDIISRDKDKRNKKGFVRDDWESIFGKEISKKHDLFYLSNKCIHKDMTFNLICGKQDYLFEGNKKLFQHLNNSNFNIKFKIIDGEHNWDTFREEIRILFEEII